MLFFELLEVTLGARDSLSRVPSAAEWGGLLAESQRQAVVGLFLDGIECLPNEQRPSQALLLQWIGLVQIAENAYTLHIKRAKELTAQFYLQGARSCVLKGIGFAQLYPHPSHRQCGDIDLWVNKSRKEMMPYLRRGYKIGMNVWHHVEASIYDEVETEIHFHPCWMYNPFHNRKLQRWFDEQAALQMEVDKNLGFAYPTVMFNAVYSLVHSYHHLIEEGLGLRHIIDYYYILRAMPAEEKETVTGLLKRFGLMRLACAMMWVLQNVCGMTAEYLICVPNEKEGKFLLSEIMAGGNFGKSRTDGLNRNSVRRYRMMVQHYPSEVLWMIPWKVWHKGWRILNN